MPKTSFWFVERLTTLDLVAADTTTIDVDTLGLQAEYYAIVG